MRRFLVLFVISLFFCSPLFAIADWSPEQIAQLSEEDLKNLSLEEFKELSEPENMLKLTTKQVVIAYKPEYLPELSWSSLHVLSPAHIRKFNSEQIKAFTPNQMRILKGTQIQSFTPNQTTYLTSDQVKSFTTKNRRLLHSSQIKQIISPTKIPELDLNKKIYGLSNNVFSALTYSQKKDLLFNQYKALSLKQFRALTAKQIASIRPEQLKALGSDKLEVLTEEHKSALTSEQLKELNQDQIKSIQNLRILSPKEIEERDRKTEAGALCLYGSCVEPMDENYKSICHALVNSPLCKDVKEDKLISCESNQGKFLSLASNVGNSIWGCLRYSVGELLAIIWRLMKWVTGHVFEDSRQNTADMAGYATDSVKLYLHSEYEKAYKLAKEPGRKAKALGAVASSIGKMMYYSMEDLVREDVSEWSCLNAKGKSGKVCAWALTVISGGILVRSFVKKIMNQTAKQSVKTTAKLVGFVGVGGGLIAGSES
ncbi:MAG: hypothetical protein OXC37_04375, partial [Bdellovibrionaceae bacterium]|nr:hypothetical protein [Pseudobdellovibrionaceae bacterium]